VVAGNYQNVAIAPAENPLRKATVPSGNSLGFRSAMMFMESAASGIERSRKLSVFGHNNAT